MFAKKIYLFFVFTIITFSPNVCFADEQPEFLTDSITGISSVSRGDKIIVDGFYFDDSSSTITVNLKKYLKNIAEKIEEIKYRRIYVDGYTDNRGGNSANNRLSRARANGVRKELIKNGIPADKIQARAYGSLRPIASNNTKSGRIQNRRIEIIIK